VDSDMMISESRWPDPFMAPDVPDEETIRKYIRDRSSLDPDMVNQIEESVNCRRAVALVEAMDSPVLEGLSEESEWEISPEVVTRTAAMVARRRRKKISPPKGRKTVGEVWMTKTTVEHWNGRSIEMRRLNRAPAVLLVSGPRDFGFDRVFRGVAVTFDAGYAALDDLIFEANGVQVVAHMWLEYPVSCNQLSHCMAKLTGKDTKVVRASRRDIDVEWLLQRSKAGPPKSEGAIVVHGRRKTVNGDLNLREKPPNVRVAFARAMVVHCMWNVPLLGIVGFLTGSRFGKMRTGRSPQRGKTGPPLWKPEEDFRYIFRDRLTEEASWLAATANARLAAYEARAAEWENYTKTFESARQPLALAAASAKVPTLHVVEWRPPDEEWVGRLEISQTGEDPILSFIGLKKKTLSVKLLGIKVNLRDGEARVPRGRFLRAMKRSKTCELVLEISGRKYVGTIEGPTLER